MGNSIITFNDVIELNHILEDKALRFKVHLHDACGSQNFSVEVISNCGGEGHFEDMQKEIIQYFKTKGIQIKFLENKLDFIILI